MCNLDSIYALIVLESAALERQPLRLMQNGSRSDIPEGPGREFNHGVHQGALPNPALHGAL